MNYIKKRENYCEKREENMFIMRWILYVIIVVYRKFIIGYVSL